MRVPIPFTAILIALCMIVSGLFSETHAKETSSKHVVGFSADGRYFAFEEFGIADGIGVAYGTLFIVDVDNNSWVKGSPITIPARDGKEFEMRDGESYEQTARRETDALRKVLHMQGQSLLDRLGPWEPGTQRASNLPWELSAPAQTVRFAHQSYVPHDRKVMRLEVSTTTFPAGKNCYDLYPDKKGLTLTLTDEKSGKIRTLQADKRVPNSRGCVQNYRVEDVINYQPADGETALAVLIRYEIPGFEGADGRLMAVTARYSVPR